MLAKFGLCSICSQNLDECSLARARKIFAIARMLGFSLKFNRILQNAVNHIKPVTFALSTQNNVNSSKFYPSLDGGGGGGGGILHQVKCNSLGSERELITKLRYLAHFSSNE